jgi:glucoamylase
MARPDPAMSEIPQRGGTGEHAAARSEREAPGHPGIAPRWTSSRKTGVGTAFDRASHVWFTISHGIFNEIYYPRVDIACLRDLGMIVTDGKSFRSEEKRHTDTRVQSLAEGVPGYHLINTCREGRYRIEKTIFTSPGQHSVLQGTIFQAMKGRIEDYRLYALASPHLGNYGSSNTAWVGEYKGTTMLFARRGGHALALACSVPWRRCSAGFVGTSDGWRDLTQHGQMTWEYTRAEDGNVALTGEIDLERSDGRFVLALGLGINEDEAGHRALDCLLQDYNQQRREYVRQWVAWQEELLPLELPEPDVRDLYRISAAVLRCHEDKSLPGGFIASLSVPWGFARGDDDLGGYHLVWPRDLIETATGLLAAGARAEAVRALDFLRATQEGNGHWAQNMWIDGKPYWTGLQLGQTALPILLIDQLRREGALEPGSEILLWPMVRRAVRFIARHGPVTEEDRWEENLGYTPYTLATLIAAFLVAADLADENREPGVAVYLRETADAWNAGIERWLYVTGTDLARQVGVEGYYIRLVTPAGADEPPAHKGDVVLKNRPADRATVLAIHLVSPDALALVRFGLRAPDDPRIVNTLKVIDALLKVDTPTGPCWHRYNDDGYGEHEDGSPYDGTGIGRVWPLLTGERAHYELAAGRRKESIRLLRTMSSFADDGGMIPEQVWDASDIPDRELIFGRPSGSAMPLAWAHAEYIKLCRSLRDGRVYDMPAQPARRYLVDQVGSRLSIWRFLKPCRTIPAGHTLRIEVQAAAKVRWTADDWATAHDAEAKDNGLDLFVADLPTDRMKPTTKVQFTFDWIKAGHWERKNYEVTII